MPISPPSPLISSMVASSIRAIQSHRKLPVGVRTNNARWAMEVGLGVDLEKVRFEQPPTVDVRRVQLSGRGPRLPSAPDILPLVHADQASRRRRGRVGVGGTAFLADVDRHPRPTSRESAPRLRRPGFSRLVEPWVGGALRRSQTRLSAYLTGPGEASLNSATWSGNRRSCSSSARA